MSPTVSQLLLVPVYALIVAAFILFAADMAAIVRRNRRPGPTSVRRNARQLSELLRERAAAAADREAS